MPVFSFLLCNLGICLIIGMILAIRHIFRNQLSSRTQYHLWFLLLGLLAVPFLPLKFSGWPLLLSRLNAARLPSSSGMGAAPQTAARLAEAVSGEWLHDFSVSAEGQTPGFLAFLLLAVWLCGILVSLFFAASSGIRLYRVRQAALPLENPMVKSLYRQCLKEAKIRREIPVYSTAFLQSPVITGLFSPRIYLPLALISDGNRAQLRYILLHELQHYRHRDAAANALAALAGTIYWFHPLVRYALGEMRNDREVACDTAVLGLLREQEYEDYGNTLIQFAQRRSHWPAPFAASMGGSQKQMQKRIQNIAFYQTPSRGKRLRSWAIFCAASLLLASLAPLLSVGAAREEHGRLEKKNASVSYIEGTPACFSGISGSFVLYDFQGDAWQIYNPKRTSVRTSPNSTYKIYDALLALESGLLTPLHSTLKWDQKAYPIEAWNGDQDLGSALRNSVNWYFQSLDARLGKDAIRQFVRQIGYGNQNVSGDLSSYWMESSLKISPTEQVELLSRLYTNDFGFSEEHLQAVRDALCLTSTPEGTLYGKTGTGQVDGKSINGWFIGWVEASSNAYFFAVNIQADDGADGTKASQIALSMLSDLEIWKSPAQ